MILNMKPETKAGRTSELSIVCPKCENEIALSEAVTHQVSEQLQEGFRAKQQAQEKLIAEREEKLREEREGLENARQGIEEEVRRKLAGGV